MTPSSDPVGRAGEDLFDLLRSGLEIDPEGDLAAGLPDPRALAPVARFGGFSFNRFELIGDAVLEQVVLEHALVRAPDAAAAQDAVTTRTSDTAWGVLAERLGVVDLLHRLEPAEEDSLAGDAVEALGGVAYAHGGWPAVEALARALGLLDGLGPDVGSGSTSGGGGSLTPYLDRPGHATVDLVEAALDLTFADPAWIAHALFPDDRQGVLAMAGSHVLEVALVLDLTEQHPDDNAYELSQRIGRSRRTRDIVGRLRRSPLAVVLGDGTVGRRRDDDTEDEAYDAARALVGAVLLDQGRTAALTATHILRA